jgi:hypothetical protein
MTTLDTGSRKRFEQFRAKPQFDVWRISQQQAFKIFDAGWQAGREELTREIGLEAINFCLSCLHVGWTADEILAAWPPKYVSDGKGGYKRRVGALTGEKP